MTIALTYPQSWEQVRLKDLMIIASVISLRLTKEEMLFSLFMKLTGCKDVAMREAGLFRMRKGKKWFSLSVVDLKKYCDSLSFILDDIDLPGVSPVKINRKLHGVSFGDYYFADVYISQYNKTHKRKYMRKALRRLHCRCVLTQNKMTAIVIWWHGLGNFFRNRYPYVFSGEGEGQYSPADSLSELLAVITDNCPQYNDAVLKQGVNDILIALNYKLQQYANRRKN